ncbi:MAG: 50S ribosomal protein L21 [Anaerolineales bacterium]|nr:50S ribosomal protein L21 [Anaerolineales bacterium]
MRFAIIESGGKQYRAVEGGLLEVDRLPVEPGTSIKLERVLLVADGENVTVGTPVVKDTPVWVKVLEHFKGEKTISFRYRPKKRIRVKRGHRQEYTRLLVQQIGGSELMVKQASTAEETPAAAGNEESVGGEARSKPEATSDAVAQTG